MSTNESLLTDDMPTFAPPARAATHTTINPTFELPNVDGTPMTVREELVQCHGQPGTFRAAQPIAPGSRVIEVPGRMWPAVRPERCCDESGRGIWFDAAGKEIPARRGPQHPAPGRRHDELSTTTERP
ncbi:hypothetical protein [Kutzneria sp. 744]|uniref:hypothetical protein n=1 Tax=Kutzneria sp. (strain 744) TaxID=345341 RepID=UPI0003EEB9DB|nr:hypothetical protein [Kutzneria sp. 744]EWM19728.1 hypothetical protein KUTG_10032 [Kutzneria sp. 744]